MQFSINKRVNFEAKKNIKMSLIETTFTERPKKLQERIFHRLFEAAEIARFSPEEKEQYEESLKSYRDLKNVIDTSFGEGKVEGRVEGRVEGIKEIASNMLKEGLDVEFISKITGLSSDEIQQIPT